jgi:hypothetical protein
MRFLILALERHMRRKLGVFEFSDDPDCLFRAQLTKAGRVLQLPDGAVSAGEPVLELHLWSEHFSPVSSEGLNMRWGVNASRQVAISCRALARYLRDEPAMRNVRAVGGTTGLFAAGEGSGWEAVLTRLGFAVMPHGSPHGRFLEFWEGFYAWMLMRAFAVGAQKPPRLRDVKRATFWMPTEDFVRRHGDGLEIEPKLGKESEPVQPGRQVQST